MNTTSLETRWVKSISTTTILIVLCAVLLTLNPLPGLRNESAHARGEVIAAAEMEGIGTW